MKHIFLFLFFSISSSAFSQTFTYIDEFLIEDPDESFSPRDFCIEVSDGKIYITDNNDEEVLVFNDSSPYDYICDIGNGPITRIREGIIVHNNRIYVGDGESDFMIEVFDLNYNEVSTINLGDQVDKDEGFAICGNTILKVDVDSITVFDLMAPHDVLGGFGNAQLDDPRGIAVSDDFIFVADEASGGNGDSIRIFDKNTFAYVASTSKPANNDSYVDGLATICDFVVVINNSTDEIDVFSATAPFGLITSVGDPAIDDLDCISTDGNFVYAADDSDEEVHIFELDDGCAGDGMSWSFVNTIDLGPPGVQPDYGDFCIATSNGKLFLQNNQSDNILVYSTTDPYPYETRFGGEELNLRDGIIIADGFLYVGSEEDSDTEFVVDVFDLDTKQLIKTIDTDVDDSCFNGGFTIDGNRLLKLDCHLIRVYDTNAPYNEIDDFGDTNLNDAEGITFNQNYIFVGETDSNDDSDNDQVVIFNRNDYSFVGTTRDLEDPEDDYRHGLKVIGEFLVVLDDDSDSDFIDVYSASPPFEYLSSIGTDLYDRDDFSFDCIAVDGNRLYIASDDFENPRVAIFELLVANIPTLSQWGMILLSLVLVIFGVVQIKHYFFLRKTE